MEAQTLVGKYFPQKWEDIQLPKRIKQLMTRMQEQEGYRLLMYGSPGSGKTSTARILTNEKSKYEVMYLSGSNDFTIDVLRNKVQRFCSGFSVDGKRKVIIIDECENIRDNLQDSFKITLDTCKSVNFIFITNEIEKVNEAVRSRCTQIEFDFAGQDLEDQKANFVRFTVDVCKAEGIDFDKEGVKTIYKRLFPDFRHLLVFLQQVKDSGSKLSIETIESFSETGKANAELYQLVCTPSLSQKEFYEQVTTFKGKERECLISLGEPFFEYLNRENKFEETLKAAIIVAKYSEMFVTSINKYVTFVSCLVELRTLFR